MTPTDVANVALLEIGQRITINSFNDTTPAAVAARTFYTPKLQMLTRTANWDFSRAQITLAVFKQAVINGAMSAAPPPQPWLYQYLWPTDCLKARFLLPTVPVAAAGTPLTSASGPIACVPPAKTDIPFVVATDRDQNGNPIKTILTNLPGAQLVYTRDLTQVPDQWDPLFLSGATGLLGCFFINALTRNKAQYDDQVAMTKSVIDQARVANGNEAISNVDHFPDWITSRRVSGINWAWNNGGPSGGYGGGAWGWDACQFPCGLTY